jgi:hypothetical protein
MLSAGGAANAHWAALVKFRRYTYVTFRVKEVKLSVTISGGLAYSFSNSIEEISKSISEGTADQGYLDQVTSKMAVLDAMSATASVQWKPGDTTKGALFTIAAELDAKLLPSTSDTDPNDSTKCDAVCSYLRRLLGPKGKVKLLGEVDTRDADVIKFKLNGKIVNAAIPLTKAGAELEDFGLLFKLQIPKKKSRRGRRSPTFLLEGSGSTQEAIGGATSSPSNTTQYVTSTSVDSVLRERRGTSCPVDLMILLDASGSIKHRCNESPRLACWAKLKVLPPTT